ncbi:MULTISPECIES: hypothetical protein [Citricoccus]|uniref:hypothetical protein n=1 Tax=Citricoccus TaxID=169133 RepID=UPI000255F221|nr:hypothetical protein [Citricoccus sp. CH26A]
MEGERQDPPDLDRLVAAYAAARERRITRERDAVRRSRFTFVLVLVAVVTSVIMTGSFSADGMDLRLTPLLAGTIAAVGLGVWIALRRGRPTD